VKASLKIEARGDNVVQDMKFWTTLTNDLSPGLGDRTFGNMPASYWVARIAGKDLHFGYKREFLRGNKDYTHSNSKGSRGIFVFFLLESENIYEVKNTRRRYFCKVDDDGDIIEITKDEVQKWIADQENKPEDQKNTPNEDWELPY
jgi:hypothetical protein